MIKLLISLAAVSLLLHPAISNAHSEHDKARFVANNGKDTGQCDNVLRPCKTIKYAVSRANKGDKVLVASGDYNITSSDELFYLKSALVPVMGGYNRFDHYQTQSPNSNVTKLKNIPLGMSEQLRAQGFSVLADGKSFAINNSLKTKLADYEKLSQKQPATECSNGTAAGFNCENIDLLAHIPLNEFSSSPSSGSDIWGHVDLNTGNEYAIMGVRNGIVVFNVTDPSQPTEVGTILGVYSNWRDIKVYQYFDTNTSLWKAYAYATTERSDSGTTDYVTVINLNNLPHSVSIVEKNRVVSSAHNVYISNVDHSLNIALPNKKASLQLVGANTKGGAFQSYSLENPETLPFTTGNFFGNGYTHDGMSLTINDQRSINDCQETESTCTIFIDFNEKEMKIWNITDPNHTNQLGSAEYFDVSKSNQYVHSGWGTEDQQYVLLHDEFDEYRGGLNTTVRIFSIENLKAPVQVGQWTGPTKAIDHNGYVRGNRYYMSNYTRGLTILDISDPRNPSQVGFFDTFPIHNNATFNGAWGVYPYLPSGNILVSDIDSGLYILKDKTKTSLTDSVSFTSNKIETAQGVSLEIPVRRTGTNNQSQAATVHYQVLAGNATKNIDYILEDGALTWSANDNSAQTINVTIPADPTGEEPREAFFIRLFNPNNNLALGQYHYLRINIDGVIDKGAANFETNTLLVAENQSTFTVFVNRLGSTTGEVSFDYQLTANEAEINTDVNNNSGRITWYDGENTPKPLTFTLINDEALEPNETFSIELLSVDQSKTGSNSVIIVTIADDDNNIAPSVTTSEGFEVNTRQYVSISAQATDPENDEMSYLWTQTAGENITLTNADSLSANFTAPDSAGVLTFEFTATDFRGAASTSTVTLTVVATTEVITVTASEKSGGSTNLYLFFILLLSAYYKRCRV